MVGNKHKNGIICTFPDCNRPMRTQKFKMHFSKKHLREGEVYSVEHRRQYEVAREDSVRTIVKHDIVPATTTTAAASLSSVEEVSASVVSTAAIAAAHEAIHTQSKELSLLQSQQAQLASHYAACDVKAEETSTGNEASPTSTQVTNTALTPALSVTSAEQTSGNKRPASAMETSQGGIDPTSVLLMQFIALMDQRFQELVGKMGEMIDVQKDLIDTLQASNPNGQAPASAFSSAVEVVMKRRKKEMNPRGDSDNDDAEANGENQAANNGVAL